MNINNESFRVEMARYQALVDTGFLPLEKAMEAILGATSSFVPRQELFISPQKQLEIFRQKVNLSLGGGKPSFTEEEITMLGEPPAWPTDRELAAVILTADLATPQMTIKAIQKLFPYAEKNSSAAFDESHFRLLPGAEDKRRLSWQVVDLAANQKSNLRLEDTASPAKSHGSALLWAAYYFSGWIRSGMSVWLPRYQLNLNPKNPWGQALYLSGCGSCGEIFIESGEAAFRTQRAIPEWIPQSD